MAIPIKSQIFHLTLALLITFATSARILDETISPVPEPYSPVDDDAVAPVSGSSGTAAISGGGASGTATINGGGAFGSGTATTNGVGASGSASTTTTGGGASGAATVSGGGAGGSVLPDDGASGAGTVSNGGAAGVGAGAGASVVPDGAHPDLTFFMHDILGGTNPSAKAITGIVTNPAVNGQVPFAKPNGAVLPTNNGLPQNKGNNGIINNNNVPFLTGLGGVNPNVMQNNGNNNNFVGGYGFPVVNGAQLSAQTSLQQLMFGTMIAIDDELTESHDLGSGMIGRAQGYYVYSSVDGKTQTMAFTTMFQEGGYVDSLNFFGVHQTSVSESLVAVMGGTGKYVSAKGFALVKTLPVAQHETDGLETVLEFNVYLTQ
ncbi:dirigent protein 10-like [Silene latifolia]|uniref:dirigent protein 10-like n=1 Tax=Silene latifolia TaxID=37657 RepID=UPI003D783163